MEKQFSRKAKSMCVSSHNRHQIKTKAKNKNFKRNFYLKVFVQKESSKQQQQRQHQHPHQQHNNNSSKNKRSIQKETLADQTPEGNNNLVDGRLTLFLAIQK